MKKVGLFFGSFDPIHIGHVNVATNVLNLHMVDEVQFVVAYSNPWKTNQTAFEDRCYMVKKTISPCEGKMFVNEIEHTVFDKYKITCTYKVLEEIKTIYQDSVDFYIITTQETYAEIPNWKNGKDIIDNNKFIIITSDHFGRFDFVPKDVDELIDIKDMPICSTNVRDLIKTNQIALPYICPEVYDYIRKNGLYQ